MTIVISLNIEFLTDKGGNDEITGGEAEFLSIFEAFIRTLLLICGGLTSVVILLTNYELLKTDNAARHLKWKKVCAHSPTEIRKIFLFLFILLGEF